MAQRAAGAAADCLMLSEHGALAESAGQRACCLPCGLRHSCTSPQHAKRGGDMLGLVKKTPVAAAELP